ncbi:hypothetical protein GCM10010168_93220 [Actinoplanes ianthinogenes]|uniref:hypothetical protein n=1 Tax=Actinoplanes ianthinogenes TaxID=122358 RepID=UPI001670F74C|nr:hypothetical protein [Actinoplanes ianthinogenes]GGR59728.1 hypothetical protein GCM10010168_93220 [Actinoplanes ianthinogenes]
MGRADHAGAGKPDAFRQILQIRRAAVGAVGDRTDRGAQPPALATVSQPLSVVMAWRTDPDESCA